MSADAFAQRILARWQRAVSAPRPLVFALLERPVAGTAPARPTPAATVNIELSPRIKLFVRLPAPAAGPRNTRPSQLGSATAPSATPSASTQIVLRTATLQRVERLLERVASRGTRVELRSYLTTAPPPTPDAGGVLRVLAPLAPATPESPALTVARPASPAQEPSEPRTQPLHEPRPATTQPVDVAALTNQVLATLDRRLVAYAERLGRT